MTSRRTRERLLRRLQEQGIANPQVLDAIRATPRHLFIEEALAHRAYEDVALPIGYSQTISQPFIVARMTEAALRGDSPLHKVLEIGTGCGYQTAVIARLAKTVYTVERIKPLLEQARKTLAEIGADNIHFQHADGNSGWAEEAPFDAIITTAAPHSVPEDLLQQLKDGGRLVIPVGEQGYQELRLITRQGDGYATEILNMVRFVPLLGGVAE